MNDLLGKPVWPEICMKGDIYRNPPISDCVRQQINQQVWRGVYFQIRQASHNTLQQVYEELPYA